VSRVVMTQSTNAQSAVPMGMGVMGEMGASGEGGGLESELLDSSVGDGEGMIGVRAATGGMSLFAGLGLCWSRLRMVALKALRMIGRRNGIEAEMMPACCSA